MEFMANSLQKERCVCCCSILVFFDNYGFGLEIHKMWKMFWGHSHHPAAPGIKLRREDVIGRGESTSFTQSEYSKTNSFYVLMFCLILCWGLMCMSVSVTQVMCVSQRTTFRSQISPSTCAFQGQMRVVRLGGKNLFIQYLQHKMCLQKQYSTNSVLSFK